MKVILDEKFATVTHEPEYKGIKIVWKDVTMSLEDYQAAFNSALEYQKTNEIKNFLSDTRKQRVIAPHFRKWFQDYAVPSAKKGGIDRGAVVITGNIFKKYYLNHILNTTKRFGIELKFFGNVEAAESWFKSVT